MPSQPPSARPSRKQPATPAPAPKVADGRKERERDRERWFQFNRPEEAEAWKDHEDLAKACEQAGMTRLQAYAVLLAADGARYKQIARDLKLPNRETRNVLRKAQSRIRRYVVRTEGLETYRVQWYRDLLRCIRGGRIEAWEVGEAERPPLVTSNAPQRYRPATAHGMVAEDLLEVSPLVFFRNLDRTLRDLASLQCAGA